MIQIAYNVFDVEAEQALFAVAEEYGVGLICRLTLAQGILTGEFQLGPAVAADHRANLSGAERIQRRIKNPASSCR